MIVSNDILSNPVNFTPPVRASIFYATRCKSGVGNCLHDEKCELLSECASAVAPNAYSPGVISQNELILNTLFYNSVYLEGPHDTDS